MVPDRLAELKQRSNCKWLQLGDRNNAFFHMSIKERKSRGKIFSLTYDVKSNILGHYHNLLGVEETMEVDCDFFDELNIQPLNPASLLDLQADITMEEIKFALWSMEDSKVPGPVGYNPFFFKQNQSIVGHDFAKAITYMFDSGGVPKGVIAIVICLIPKIPNPSEPGNFSPISLCNKSTNASQKYLP